MRGENKTNGNIYRFDDVTIDGENFRLQKNGQNVTLTPRAFDVLIFLLENGGRVVEKQEIFDSVWKDTFVSDNALTKIIKEIRQAIGDDASEPRYIETVPKRGYRFIADVKNGSEKDEAGAEANKSFAPLEPLRPDGTKKINGQLALIYAMTGRKREAQMMLTEMEKQTEYIIPFNLARIYAALGEKEKAFAWLEKAFEKREGSLVQLKVTPHFGAFRDDPRFADLVRRIGLKP